ncbi:hypothetical protein NGRA_1716 [Nosema granulosis]|uniref:NTF2 domain-containing protein n=1 Tax=Nosema granulosis TaxID=83296 RepID=A0A9P6GYF8_9MICR|nr:hypothetical protein NGRA_1716 [Nosema granulosis]
MSSFTQTEETKFIKFYYDLLCNDISRLSALYSQDYKCHVARENHDHLKHTSVKACLTKPVFKILISSISPLEIEQGLFVVNVVGQIVYVDRTQHRISHQFVLKKTAEYKILSEIFTILDEEIIYDAYDTRICISNPKKEFLQVVQDVSKHVTVETVEQKGSRFLVKINRQSNISYEELRNRIEAEGYKFEKII